MMHWQLRGGARACGALTALVTAIAGGCDGSNPVEPGPPAPGVPSIGSVLSLSQADLISLRLLPGKDGKARYLLAFAHEAPILSVAVPGPAPLQPQFDSFTVTIADRTGSASLASSQLASARHLLRETAQPGTDFQGMPDYPASTNEQLTQRTGPWKVADEATIQSLIRN